MSDVMRDAALTDRDYEELGREIVKTAFERTQQWRQEHEQVGHDDQVDGGRFSVRLRFHPNESGRFRPDLRGAVCCVCVQETDMVICRGGCCR